MKSTVSSVDFQWLLDPLKYDAQTSRRLAAGRKVWDGLEGLCLLKMLHAGDQPVETGLPEELDKLTCIGLPPTCRCQYGGVTPPTETVAHCSKKRDRPKPVMRRRIGGEGGVRQRAAGFPV